MSKDAEVRADREKSIALNRKAKFKYEILDRFEAGIALTGSEVKSCRAHKVGLSDAYARFQGGELFLVNLDIATYEHAGYVQHEPKRVRKLLMHRLELRRLLGKVTERGLTMVPLGVHFNSRGLVKISLALARGRQEFDKRRVIRERENKVDIARQTRKYK